MFADWRRQLNLASIVYSQLSQASLRLLVLEGNEQLEGMPPVEQGPKLLKVVSLLVHVGGRLNEWRI